MSDFLKRKKICIVGIGETELGKVPGKSSLQFHTEATKLAMEDAGITKDDINGVITAFSFVDHTFMHCTTFAEYAGMSPKYFYNSMAIGGSTAAWMAAQAAMAIDAGLADVVLCVRGDNTATGQVDMISLIKEMSHIELEYPYGLMTPGGYGLLAQRHMHDFGTTSEQIAQIAVSARKHAANMPNAVMKKPITVDDVVNSPMICSPMHVLDCCLVTDGGGAFIVASEEKAKELNMKNKPVYLKGIAQESTHQYISQAPDLKEILRHYRIASDKAFNMAGIERKDIDVAEIYDCFTITTLLSIEGLGFCGIGEGGSFVENGNIELGGQLPVNTHGGLLSQAHLGGMFHINEAVRQIRGTAGPRQVPNAKNTIVTGNGGLFSSQTMMILGDEA